MSLKFKTRGAADDTLSKLFKMAELYANNQIAKDKAVADALERDSKVKSDVATNYSDYVDNIVTPQDVTAANIYSGGLEGMIKDSPEAFFTKKSADAKLNEKTSEMAYYQTAINGAYDKHNATAGIDTAHRTERRIYAGQELMVFGISTTLHEHGTFRLRNNAEATAIEAMRDQHQARQILAPRSCFE